MREGNHGQYIPVGEYQDWGGGQEMGVESNSKRNIDVKLRSLVSVPWMALCDTPGILSREMKQELFGREAVLVFLGKVE